MHKVVKIFVIFGIILIILVAGSNLLIYRAAIKYTNNQVNMLSSDIVSTRQSLMDAIIQEKEFSSTQRSLLENQTAANFRELESFLESETSRLELDFGSQLEGISNEVEGLEEIVSDIDVTSSDFSSIIDDIIKAVVSIRTNSGQGSGVFFDSDGYIITNKHVIQGASTIQIVDYNSQVYNVVSVGNARDVDLAVLKIEGNGFEALNFALSSDINVGERVIAVGNPLGLSFTVTEGIISATNRVVDSSGVGYIQTDVPINPGNSGGPLINSRKEIVGINTFIIADTQGIGFAIPSEVAENIANQALI